MSTVCSEHNPAAAHRFDVSHDYVASRGATSLDEFEREFESILRKVERFHPVTAETSFLEVGAGLGWFEIICAKRGLRCSAIEFNPVVLDGARDLARRHGVDIDIALGDVQDADLGRCRYDIVISSAVFEHVRDYGRALARVYEALRPGGVFYFYSTNKFSLSSGEYSAFPLYGWFPYPIRRRIRVSRQGPGIVESCGIDFNQFTHWGLSRHLRSLGFSRVLDQIDYLEPEDVANRGWAKPVALRAARTLPPIRLAARTFARGTSFICVK